MRIRLLSDFLGFFCSSIFIFFRPLSRQEKRILELFLRRKIDCPQCPYFVADELAWLLRHEVHESRLLSILKDFYCSGLIAGQYSSYYSSGFFLPGSFDGTVPLTLTFAGKNRYYLSS